MKNMPPFLLALDTDIIYPRANLQPSPVGKEACVAIVIQNPLNNIDAAGSGNALDLQVGKRTGQPYQMLPGTESPVIYCRDLEEVYVRVRKAVVIDDVTFDSTNYCVIVYRERRDKR